MNRNLLIIAAIALLTSCGNSEAGTEQTTAQPEMQETAAAPELSAADKKAAILAGKMDPVCEMDYDAEWTESAEYMGSTIHFCSEGCKTAFTARPEKYIKAEQ